MPVLLPVRRWVDVLRQQAIGASRLGLQYAALKFLYARTLGQPEKVAWITLPKAKAPLPSILARTEIQRLSTGVRAPEFLEGHRGFLKPARHSRRHRALGSGRRRQSPGRGRRWIAHASGIWAMGLAGSVPAPAWNLSRNSIINN
jgi:hypothetical protein